MKAEDLSEFRHPEDPGWQDMPDCGDNEAAEPAFSGGPHRVRASIQIRAGELHIMATAGEDALIAAKAPFYTRGGIVRPIVDDLPAAKGRRTKVARLAEVSADMLVDHLSRCADWTKFDGRKKRLVLTDPPRPVAATILARDGEWRFPRLAGVITTPTLRPDGTILSTPGYDPGTQLLLLDPPCLPMMPAKPTKAQAMEALVALDALLDEFPFVDEASRSVALSGLITPVVRGAMPVAPMHVTSAPVAGSGKSYIIDLAAAISIGQRAPVIAAGRDEAETEKRLVSALFGGQPIISIDNVNGDLGGDFLCQMIERPIVEPRILGSSKLIRIESRATTFATGNNIRLVGDMTRRVVLCSLDPNMERPELREFRGHPFDQVLADRGKYVAAALTIARAYIVASCPGQLPALASFEDWSRIVRSALVWLGRPDPVETMEAARADDPTTTSLRAVLAAWHGAIGAGERTIGKVVQTADEQMMGSRVHSDFHQVLLDVAPGRLGDINGKSLGLWLARHKGRVVDGLKIVDGYDKNAKQKTWAVVRVL
jgi:putative DNA primase/helicase